MSAEDNVHIDTPAQREAYYDGAGEHALYFIEGSKNCIADHLSLSWSTTKILTIDKMSDLISIQSCNLNEGLLTSPGHGLAIILGQGRLSFHHNLIAHNASRNPRFGTLVDADFRNNVIYDWGDTAGLGEFDRVNYVGNYLKPGPSTRREMRSSTTASTSSCPTPSTSPTTSSTPNDTANADNWRRRLRPQHLQPPDKPFPAPPGTTGIPPRPPTKTVLSNAGAYTLPQRDAVARPHRPRSPHRLRPHHQLGKRRRRLARLLPHPPPRPPSLPSPNHLNNPRATSHEPRTTNHEPRATHHEPRPPSTHFSRVFAVFMERA